MNNCISLLFIGVLCIETTALPVLSKLTPFPDSPIPFCLPAELLLSLQVSAQASLLCEALFDLPGKSYILCACLCCILYIPLLEAH